MAEEPTLREPTQAGPPIPAIPTIPIPMMAMQTSQTPVVSSLAVYLPWQYRNEYLALFLHIPFFVLP
jgi:hypothetical protein